jgi:hypothetical protein
MANSTNEYIVFEADQVLTNDHLNEMFNYLDQQNRWTRNKLIGIGIACGLTIKHQTGIIEISGGCGVTSQGYLIVQPKSDYAYIIPYSPIAQPNDLPFQYTGNLPFFKPYCGSKTIYLLLTDNDYNALEESKKAQAKTLSSQTTSFLNDYAVVLFLEANELDLKNCDTFDCTNKGEKMQFAVRPLLVKKTDLPTQSATSSTTGTTSSTQSHQIKLKRYNVPYANLKNSFAVIKAFTALVDDETLQGVSNAFNYCYQQYGSMLGISSNAFSNLFKLLQDKRELILKEYPIFIQYFYDFVDDLINAYYEFRVKMSDVITKCCPDENLFPLHLVLGDASKDTDANTKDSYRTYFIYSPLFAKGNNETGEGLFLYRRMEIMIKEFEILISSLKQRTQQIKITPSQLGLSWLSERAIPYYYDVMAGASPLYKNWSFYKTSHGNAAFNQSYNANLYNSSSVMTEPLLYDIEHYNFFRVEGHIGENYQRVLGNIMKQRLQYNLPFDVVAISADLLKSNAVLPQCNMQDIETDYKLIISEFACKVHTPLCFLTKFPYPPDAASTNINQAADLKAFSSFRMEAVGHFTDISSLMSTATTYKKGDFMRKYCPPAANTIGSYYLQQIKSGNFSIDNTNTELGNDQNALMLIYTYVFAFIDAVEELMLLLMTRTVATLNIAQLKVKYAVYTKALSLLVFILAELINKTSDGLSFAKELEIDLLIDEFFVLSSVCIDERLQTLIEEYRRRLALYQSQNTFLNYFKKHPGLEHKAGVPKGGTFVIVYYENEAGFYKRNEVTDFTQAKEADTSISAEKRLYMATGEKTVDETVAQTPAVLEYFDNDTAKLITDFVTNCTDGPADKKQKIIDIINQQRNPVNYRFELTNGAVIADFYIPYLCCSDCPPVAYILPKEEKEPPVDITAFSIKPSIFLFDDAHNYAFTASPAVTTANKGQTNFTSPDITNKDNLKLLTDDNNILYLHPAMDIQQTLQAIVMYKGISASITIVKPDASFTLTITSSTDATGLKTYSIATAAKQTDATSYKWFVLISNVQTGNNYTSSKIDAIPVDGETSLVEIELEITYVLNGNTSVDTKLVSLKGYNEAASHADKGSFELPYDQINGSTLY